MYGYDDYYSSASILGGMTAYLFVMFAVSVFFIICNWKLFEKAGEAGWKAIIPIYNTCIMSKIATGSMAYWLLGFIPLIGFVFLFIVQYKFYKKFGSSGLAVLGLFFPVIVIPILAFSKSTAGETYEQQFDGYNDDVRMGEPVMDSTIIRCANCGQIVQGVQSGQRFICGYCCTEQTAN